MTPHQRHYRCNIASLLFVACAHAATYTWTAGVSGSFTDPANWQNAQAPDPAGSPADQLSFPADTSEFPGYTVTFDSPTAYRLNALAFTNSDFGSSTTNLITGVASASLLFDGPNPTISVNANYGSTQTIALPIASTSDLTLTATYGALRLTGPLSSSASGSSLIVGGNSNFIYQNNNSPTGFAQVLIGPNLSSNRSSQLVWSFAPPDATPATLSLGSGPIVLAGSQTNPNLGSGVFGVELLPATIPVDPTLPLSGLLSGLGLPTVMPASADITNPIIIQGAGTLQGGMPALSPIYDFLQNPLLAVLPPPPTATIRYSGPIMLNGSLTIGTPEGDASSVTTIVLSGPITLDPSHDLQPEISSSSQPVKNVIISGDISAPPAGKPLILSGPPSNNSILTIAGSHNTYSAGTILSGNVTVAPNSSLGTGNVTVSGVLHLTALTNLAPGTKARLDPTAALAINFDQNPAALIDPASGGILALDTNFTTPLDMSQLGNGTMALGSTTGGVYAAPSLAPAADHVYRFALPQYSTGAAPLTLATPVLIDYAGIPTRAELDGVQLMTSNTYSGGTHITGVVYARATGALGTGDVSVGPQLAVTSTLQQLYLTVPGAYSSTARVDVYNTLLVVGPDGALDPNSRPPILHPGSALVLGDTSSTNSDRYPDTFPLNLNSSSLYLKGAGTTAETVGPITASGLSSIILQPQPSFPSLAFLTGQSFPVSLSAPTLTLAPHSVLILGDLNKLPPAFDLSNFGNIHFDSAPAVTNGMVSPAIQVRAAADINSTITISAQQPSFLTYSAAGFAPVTYVPMPTDGGDATQIVEVTRDLVTGLPNVLPGNTSIYALRATTSLDNPPAGPATLHIASGGLIIQNNYWADLTIAPDIEFGPSEAFINTAHESFIALSGLSQIILSGRITGSGGLTKFGSGSLQLTNPNNQITGPITVLEGSLQLATLPSPQSQDPITLAAGTTLSFTESVNLTRPVVFQPAATTNGKSAITISITDGRSLTISAPITGPGELTLAGASIFVNAPINITQSLHISGDVHFAAPVTCGGMNITQGRMVGNVPVTSPFLVALGAATLAPGDNPGDIAALSINGPGLEFELGSTLQLDLTATGLCDQLLLTGLADIYSDPDEFNPMPALTLNFLSPPTGQTYTLISAASITGQFQTVTGLPDGYTLDYSHPGLLLLAPASSVPEPATLPATILTSAYLLIRRRTPNPIASQRNQAARQAQNRP